MDTPEFEAAQAAWQAGEHARALALLDELLAHNDGEPELWSTRGQWLQALGQTDAARASFDRALALDHEFVPALRCQAILERSLGRRAEAEQLLGRIAAARPNDPAAAFELARALTELPKNRQIDIDPGGRGWRALEAIRRAIELAPDDPHAWALEVQLLGVLMHANVSFRRMGPGFQPELVAGPLRTGRFFDELVACCEAAMARFDRDPWFPRRLANAWEFAGDSPRAVELRRRASELDANVTRK